MMIVDGAEYIHKAGGPNVIVLGETVNNVVFSLPDGTQRMLNRHIFTAEYKDAGKHDHENYCCLMHDLHSVPHRGCLFR